jgi:predicted transcriptional regulator
MKAILLSVKPEWVAKILNGEKTIEIRKTMPKCELPIDVYIYCTNDKSKYLYWDWYDPPFVTQEWFVSKNKHRYVWEHKKHKNGKIIVKFTLRQVEKIIALTKEQPTEYYAMRMDLNSVLYEAKLSKEELQNYLKNKDGYAWYISDLEFFDKPKELSDFGLKKAPQSWCYVEN